MAIFVVVYGIHSWCRSSRLSHGLNLKITTPCIWMMELCTVPGFTIYCNMQTPFKCDRIDQGAIIVTTLAKH